jgi:predicted Zn-dependent protease
MKGTRWLRYFAARLGDLLWQLVLRSHSSSHRPRARARAKTKGKNKDPDPIGSRDVGKGLNFYSLEKENALGKQMAQEVERDAKIVYDPVIGEYVSRLGQNLARSLRRQSSVNDKDIGYQRG